MSGAAVVQRSLSVDDVYLVPGTVPQHAYAVAAFFGVQAAEAAVHFMCVKQFHSYKFTFIVLHFQI